MTPPFVSTGPPALTRCSKKSPRSFTIEWTTPYEAGAGTPTVKWTATSTPPVQVSVVPLYAGLFEDAPQPVTGPLSGPVSCSLDGD
jgi:hypothetical protein